MRAAISFAIVLLATTAASADDDLIPGVSFDDGKANGFMGVVIGHVSIDTQGDNLGHGQEDYSAWIYGISARAEYVGMRSAYNGRFGASFELDLWLVTPGSYEQKAMIPAPQRGPGPDEPKLQYVYAGITPGIMLGLAKTKNFELSLELGAPINTDFYGLSASTILHFHKLYFSYKLRSGYGWQPTHVLDERWRIGYADDTKHFGGIEIMHGYNEDDMSRANLGALFKGGYTTIALVLSAGY